MTSFRNGKEESYMHKCEISIFAEDSACGMWRLQTNEPTLVRVMNERAKQPRSPWSIVGRGLTATDPMIYRRSFSSSTKAKISLERILMRMDAEPYELVNVTVGRGWGVQRTSAGSNQLKRCHSSPNISFTETEKEVA
jgi:hypothetical protein|tara:strand:+ start:1090 stop:1503 length:414 start_codon:yes stop_codon:yes gene_type:complete